MNNDERKKQLMNRIKCALCLVIGMIIGGILVAVILGKNSRLESEPDTRSGYCQGLDLGTNEVTELVHQCYINFLSMSYILVGDDWDTGNLYKISSKVPRHHYDFERLETDESGYMSYSDDTIKKSKFGIDVSNHQGEIDWKQVKKAGVDFAMLRLGYRGYTQGGLALDETFVTNAEEAAKARVKLGVYFYSQAVSYEEGVEEAEFVLENIKEYRIKYPVVIDTEYMEVDGARANDISNDARTDAVVGFCETIKAAGYTPMIYANRNWFVQNLDMDRLGGYDLWVAQYANAPDFPYLFKGWQYTSEGSVPGITGEVDLNVWFE